MAVRHIERVHTSIISREIWGLTRDGCSHGKNLARVEYLTRVRWLTSGAEPSTGQLSTRDIAMGTKKDGQAIKEICILA